MAKEAGDDQTEEHEEHFPVPMAFGCKNNLFHFLSFSLSYRQSIRLSSIER